MKKRLGTFALVALGAVGVVAIAAMAPRDAQGADHGDSPAPSADPGADIADFFAWMSTDGASVNMITTVNPFAGADAEFPTSTQYVFHTNSRAAFTDTAAETNDVVCQFYDANAIECWVIDNDGNVAAYVEGDPSNEAGLTNAAGNLRVYAGRRNDPFYFELGGFANTATTVRGAAPSLTFDAANCPDLDMATSDLVVAGLTTDDGDGTTPAADDLAGAAVLALVVEVDETLVNTGGDIVGVWGSTHTAP